MFTPDTTIFTQMLKKQTHKADNRGIFLYFTFWTIVGKKRERGKMEERDEI